MLYIKEDSYCGVFIQIKFYGGNLYGDTPNHRDHTMYLFNLNYYITGCFRSCRQSLNERYRHTDSRGYVKVYLNMPWACKMRLEDIRKLSVYCSLQQTSQYCHCAALFQIQPPCRHNNGLNNQIVTLGFKKLAVFVSHHDCASVD